MKKKRVLTKKKKVVRRTAKKAALPKPIGVVTHYYGEIGVGIVKFNRSVARGTSVAFRGATTDFVQPLSSMQYDHKDIVRAPKGKQIGVKTKKRVREGDEVFLLE